jgi:hypothetical protein
MDLRCQARQPGAWALAKRDAPLDWASSEIEGFMRNWAPKDRRGA